MLRAIFYALFSVIILLASIAIAGTAIDWKSCQNKDMDNSTVPFNSKGEFKEECAPEVLYSWRSDDSLAKMVESQKKGIGPVEGHPKKKVFSSKSPLSSHAYGNTAVRLKLRKDVKFVSANNESDNELGYEQRECYYYKQKYPDDYKRIVVVATLKNYSHFSEYILCDDGPIESWSYGIAAHLVEAEKEYAYYKLHPEAGNHENVLPNVPLATEKETTSTNDYKICPDGKDCRQKTLDERMERHRKLAKEGEGRIFYMTHVEEISSHFDNKKEFYYSLTNADKEEFELRKTVKKGIPLPLPSATQGEQ